MTKSTQEVCITDKLNSVASSYYATNSRNYGIDLLRITAMIMIVVLHVLNRGGIIKNAVPFTLKYEIAWGLEILCYIGVNLYALISGYAGLYSKYKPYKLIPMWFQVELYTLLSVLLGSTLGSYKINNPISYFLPITYNGYWYFTAYAGLFLFIPLLNKAILSLDKKSFERMFVFAALMLSVFALFCENNAIGLKKGYSTIFLMILYMLGGYLRKYDIPSRFSKAQLWVVFIISSVLSFVEKNLETLIEKVTGGKLREMGIHFAAYNNLLFIISAVALFMIFTKLTITNGFLIKIIKLLAPLTFGVYIIHLSPAVWYYLNNSTKFLLDKPIAVMVLGIILFTAGIYLSCSLIEYIRFQLFRILKIEELSKLIYSLIVKIWHRAGKSIYALYKLTAPDDTNK